MSTILPPSGTLSIIWMSITVTKAAPDRLQNSMELFRAAWKESSAADVNWDCQEVTMFGKDTKASCCMQRGNGGVPSNGGHIKLLMLALARILMELLEEFQEDTRSAKTSVQCQAAFLSLTVFCNSHTQGEDMPDHHHDERLQCISESKGIRVIHK
jgi:hypothetical protein